jgi:hypothetical protein
MGGNLNIEDPLLILRAELMAHQKDGLSAAGVPGDELFERSE